MKAAPKPDRTFEVYPDTSKSYRWRTRAKNGQITAVSGESFASRRNARRAALRENGRHIALFNAAEQFVASCKDGDVAKLLDYYQDIFEDALKQAAPAVEAS